MPTKKQPAVKKPKASDAIACRLNSIQINQTHLGISQQALTEALDMYSSWSINAIYLGLAAAAVGIINSLLIITLFFRK